MGLVVLAVAGIGWFCCWMGYTMGYDHGYHDKLLRQRHRDDRVLGIDWSGPLTRCPRAACGSPQTKTWPTPCAETGTPYRSTSHPGCAKHWRTAVVDPLAAMRAACLAIADGEANEIEMEWSRPTNAAGELEERLTITVRRQVKHFRLGEGTYTEGSA